MHRRSMLLALILTLASFGCSDQILAPEAPSVAEVEGVVPLMSQHEITPAIVLIGSTDEGELVRIDIAGPTGAAFGQVRRLGDSGVLSIKGDPDTDVPEDPNERRDVGTEWNVGWMGLTFGPLGVLYTLSRTDVDPRQRILPDSDKKGCDHGKTSDSKACAYIYSVNLDATIIADHGLIFSGGNVVNGSTFLSDLDFDGSSWGALRTSFGRGKFAFIDEEQDGDFVYNPRYTSYANGAKFAAGGLSYHPGEGEWWGVEDNGKPALYKIIPGSARAGPTDVTVQLISRLDTKIGFSGMEITHDGRVFLSQSFGEVYELVDRNSGETRRIDLGTIPSTIQGNLTGLEEFRPDYGTPPEGGDPGAPGEPPGGGGPGEPPETPDPDTCKSNKSHKSDKSCKSDKSGKSGKSGKKSKKSKKSGK